MAQKQLVWIITGTATGFGRELVLSALGRGDKVIATARKRSLAKLDDLKKAGADVLELDVTSSLEQLQGIAKEAHNIHGRLDVLVNNAGYGLVGAIEESTPEETYDQFNTNVFGGLNVARAVLPYMRAQKSGTVVWVGSVGGWRAAPNMGLYAATKFTVRGIAETLDAEISPLGLRSYVFEPGYFRTSFLSEEHRGPYVERISDYAEITKTANQRLLNYNGKQPGDPQKAVKIIIDTVRGEGFAKGKTLPVAIQLGSDCVDAVTAVCQKTVKNIE